MGDGTWVYPNATQIAAVALTKDVPSLFSPKNDVLEEEKKKRKKGKEKEEKRKRRKEKDDGEDSKEKV